MLKTIKLNKKEKYAIVDKEDYSELSKYNWGLDATSWKEYARVALPNYGKKIRMHQLIIGNIPSGYVIDHKDGNGLNNSKSNLRIVTKNINGLNSNKRKNYYFDNSSRKYDVWVSYRINNKREKIFGGSFSDENEAKIQSTHLKSSLINKLLPIYEYKDHVFYKEIKK